MVKCRVEAEGSFKAYGQLGVMAKLGEGLTQTGFLGNEQMTRTIQALKLCRETASLESIKHVQLVGTSPVREAANREEFLRRVHDETGLSMRVLSGNEEALYGFLGAARSVGAQTALFFDLGGGSLELTYSEKYRVKGILSLPLGALKLTSMYAGKDGTFSRKARAKLAKHISDLLPTRRELGLDKDAVIVGTGGTVRAMARFDQNQIEYPLNKVHNYQIEYDSVQQMSREFFRLSLEELGNIDAIGETRSPTIAAGGLVVRLLMEELGFKRLTASTHGLRDGILIEFLDRGQSPRGLAQKEDVERLLVREALPQRLTGMGELAECLARNDILDLRQKTIILAAMAKGRSRDSAEADPDALFGILMSEDLPMSHEDQIFMATSLVRARRARSANWLVRKYGGMMSRDDVKSLKKMGTCLRLMEVLDRAGAQIRVAYSGGLRISVIDSRWPFPLELARSSALNLSTSIKRPVSIFTSAKEKERHTGLLRTAT